MMMKGVVISRAESESCMIIAGFFFKFINIAARKMCIAINSAGKVACALAYA
jgi:hypothetical protein